LPASRRPRSQKSQGPRSFRAGPDGTGAFCSGAVGDAQGPELTSSGRTSPGSGQKQLAQCDHLLNLEKKLAAVLKGDMQPRDAGERLGLASLCQIYKKRPGAAARFYAEAFAADPKLADDLRTGARYYAACAAALAGCGRGKDAKSLDEKERGRLRQQAR